MAMGIVVKEVNQITKGEKHLKYRFSFRKAFRNKVDDEMKQKSLIEMDIHAHNVGHTCS